MKPSANQNASQPGGPITSIKDEVVVEARSLQTAKGRIAAGRCLAEGEEQIRWALGSPCRILHAIVHEKQTGHPILKDLRDRGIPIFTCSDGILRKVTETNHLIPFVAVVECQAADSLEKSGFGQGEGPR
ncbi:MAG: hypothetical protein ACOYKZ_03725 [Chlamydiia bacterium]